MKGFPLFKSISETLASESLSIEQIAERLKSDRQVKAVCEMLKMATDEQTLQRIKKSLPVVCVSASGLSRASGAEPGTHTGYAQLDVDLKDSPGKTTSELRALVETHPAVKLAYTSPRGGVKAFAACVWPELQGELPQATPGVNDEACKMLEAWCAEKGIKMDSPVARNPKSLSFLAHDQTPFLRPDSELKPLILELGGGPQGRTPLWTFWTLWTD